MISVSDRFLELMQSNIRPKIEPIITVKGQDANGNIVNLVWTSSNIQNMTYKRGIDPVGRSLPYMELTWTEIYYGKLNSDNYPEKYNNIVKYMSVELSFEQNLGFFNIWKNIHSTNNTWKQVLEKYNTWKKLKKDVEKEIISLPIMFLTAKPTIENQTITWTAKDLLYFLEEPQVKSFYFNYVQSNPLKFGIEYINPIRYFLLSERGNFRNSNEIFNSLTKSQRRITNVTNDNIINNIIFDGTTKNILMNYASIKNYFWNFKDDYLILENFSNLTNKKNNDIVFDFSSNIIRSFPKLTENTNISLYRFKLYKAIIDSDNKYSLQYSEKLNIFGKTFYKFLFKDFGIPKSGSDFAISNIAKDAIDTIESIDVAPVNFNNYEYEITTNQEGIVFDENNPLNPFNSKSPIIIERVNLLKKWFKSQSYSMELESLPNVAIEPGDLVSVCTNLYKENEQIIKNAIVVGIELTYNGALKQKTLLHEVSVSND